MTHQSKPIGRPSKNGPPGQFQNTALLQLLKTRLPSKYLKENGDLNTRQIATDCKVSRMSVYRWLHTMSLSITAARALIAISKGGLSNEDVIPFMLPA